MSHILSRLLEKFGDGLRKDGPALKQNSVANVVAEENYMPIISSLLLTYKQDLQPGIIMLTGYSSGNCNRCVLTAIKVKVKRKQKKGQ